MSVQLAAQDFTTPSKGGPSRDTFPLTMSTSTDDLASILKTTFPHMVSYDSTKTVSQANAEGQRLVLTLHEDEDPYDHAVFVKDLVEDVT